MHSTSLKWKLVWIGVAAIFAVGAITVGYGIALFRAEIGRLYSQDYSERIRNIEFEYDDLREAVVHGTDSTDADTAATTSPTPRVPVGAGAGAEAPGEVAADAETPETAAGPAREADWAERSSRRDGLLERLNNRFIEGRALAGRLFIFNGDRDMVLFEDTDEIRAEMLLDAVFEGIVAGRQSLEGGEREVTIAGSSYWIAYSYYPPWDWYTGFAVPDSVRFAGLIEFTRNIVVAILVIIVLFAIVYLRFLSRTLKPFAAIPVAMQRFLDGDVNQQLPVRGRDEVSLISRSFNDFVGQLREILSVMQNACDENTRVENELTLQANEATTRMRTIRESTATMKDRIAQLNGNVETSSELMERVGEHVRSLRGSIEGQVSGVSQSTAAIEQMSASLDSVAGITKAKKQSSVELTQRAEEGGTQLAEMQKSIGAVSASVSDIAGFVDVIRNIAAQTNLLSMNASIEAAHAGEAGRGFAVVAGEIRKLAGEAGKSSQSIDAVIGEIVERIRATESLSNRTGEVFEAIIKEVHAVADSLQEIASATDELAAGSTELRNAMTMLSEISTTVQQGSDESQAASDEIVQAMSGVIEISAQLISEISDIDARTEQGASDLEHVTHTAGELSASVASLQSIMGRFRVGGSSIT